MAQAFVQRMRQATEHLPRFPKSGRVVPERKRGDVREIFVEHYRVMYKVEGKDTSHPYAGVREGARFPFSPPRDIFRPVDVMQRRVEEFLAGRTIALVGATDKPEKWGYKIFRHLAALGYEVLPVHPAVSEIDGAKVHPGLRDLPKMPDGVSIVVPPPATEETVRLAKELGIRRAWMQPGAESEAAIAFCDANGLSCIHHRCILTETSRPAGSTGPSTPPPLRAELRSG